MERWIQKEHRSSQLDSQLSVLTHVHVKICSIIQTEMEFITLSLLFTVHMLVEIVVVSFSKESLDFVDQVANCQLGTS
jgi:hypothetical protein